MTIKEIAQLAGVSSAAVSRYLNGGYVSAEKQELIRKVIQETGYRPLAQARTLRTKRARLIGVVVPKINSESISRVTEGVGQVLSRRGYQMLLASTGNDASKEVEYLRLFENYPVDGIILVGTIFTAEHKKFLKATGIPVVVIGQYTKLANCVCHDDYGAGLDMGRKAALYSPEGNIAYLGVTREDKAAGAAREDGFLAGLEEGGAPFRKELRRVCSFTMESGCQNALDILRSLCDIDIICCATDTIAAGAIEAIRQYCGDLKKDDTLPSAQRKPSILVTGFGDNQFLKAVTGGIPTVHFAYKTSGMKGAELLLDAIEDGQDIPVEIRLGFKPVCASKFTQREG